MLLQDVITATYTMYSKAWYSVRLLDTGTYALLFAFFDFTAYSHAVQLTSV